MTSLCACSTTAQVQEGRNTPSPIVPREAVAFLTSSRSPLEDKAVGCISEAVRTAMPKVPIIAPEEFRRSVFAAWPPDDAAKQAKYLTALANEPTIRDRINSLRIRYLVSVGGQTVESEHVAAGDQLGFLAGGHRQSHLAASVLDLKEVRPAGELRADASGKFGFALLVFIPLWQTAPTEAQVCKEISEGVVNYLMDKATPGASATPEPRNQ